MMNNKQFEVPYNFSKKLLSYYSKNADRISYLFVPPYKEDSLNTRSPIETRRKGSCYMPTSRKEYECCLRSIVQAGLRYVILWQFPDAVLSSKMITYYKNLGAAGFIVGSDENAKRVKTEDQDLIVICSLVQRVCHQAFYRDFKDYDYVLLYYPYNRGLNALKEASRIKEKIILMPNTLCYVDCPSIHHWFPNPQKPFVVKRDCPALKNMDMSGFISPEHLYLFDDWVGGYKIQGREYSSDFIIYICSIYFERKSPQELLNAMLGEELAEVMRRHMMSMTLEEYYNVKSGEILGGAMKEILESK